MSSIESAVASGASTTGGPRQRALTVDLHCHTLSLEVEKLVAQCPQKLAEPEQALRFQGAASVEHNAKSARHSVNA